MSVSIVNNQLRDGLIDICKKYHIDQPRRLLRTKNNIDIPILQLDKLWHHSEAISKLGALSVEAIRTWPDFDIKSIDTIVGVTSNLASYGPIPLLGLLAKELVKDIIIACETTMGEFSFYPSMPAGEVFRKKSLLLIKDGVISGASISRLVKIVTSLKGTIGGILIFVDFDNLNSDTQNILNEYPTIEFLLGDKINLIIQN